jgi:PAS domain S-box-containing protein
MNSRGGSRPRIDSSEASWFEESQQQALRDLWPVYEAHRGQIEGETSEHARANLLSAASGDFSPLREHLEQRGIAHADAGVGLSAACGEARAFTRALLPRLLEAYGSDLARLGRVLQVMNDLADRCAEVIADAYLARRDASTVAREQDLATTLDSIGDAVIVTDASGLITRMNPVAERLTGFPLADCIHRSLGDVFKIEDEDTGEAVESPVVRVLREGVVVGLANHTVLVARDGTRRPIADSGAPIRHETGEIRGVVLVFRDVAAQRKAEESLRHWERIFQYASWGVGLARASDICIEAVNPAYAEMHGYTVAELIGASVSKLWAPETRADMERHAHETRDHGRLVVETTHLRKDGSRMPVEVIGSVVRDAHDQPVYFVANVQDISERKRLQQAQIRAIELEAENRRIEEANRTKSEFLANMSHELRTPLNSIIGFAELLHDEQAGPIEPNQKDFLGEILAGGVHLLRLINDVLDLAKVEAGKMEFLPEPVDLTALVGSVVQSLFATAKSKHLEVEVSVDPGIAPVELDPGRFTQLLHNYVSNALKFTPDGGRVVVRVLPEGSDRFRLEVEDTGPGVAEEDTRRLFVPFQQLDSGATKRHGGTGLGLALTKRLAEAQGGSVGMRASAGGGSVFFAVLPCRPVGDSEIPRRADVPAATSVLVIENDPDDREVVARVLRDAGYAVDAVATSAEGMLAWKQHSYDAITLSVLTPDSDDLRALLRRIRSEEGRAQVPVIALAVVADAHAAAGFAVTDVLTKPVDAVALITALERGGAPPARGKPVLIVDDDPGSLRLMEATLAKLGYEALCFSNAADALVALEKVRPAAIVLDLLMPSMDGFVFLERLRGSAEHSQIPVMIWTVKDLSPEERRHLHAAAQAIVQKGAGDDFPLSAVVRGFLPASVGGRSAGG